MEPRLNTTNNDRIAATELPQLLLHQTHVC